MGKWDEAVGKVGGKMVEARVEFMGQVAKFSAGELAMQAGEDEWSPLRLAHHLYIADGLALEQMQTVQNEDNPLLMAADEEAPRRTRASKPPASLDAVLAGMAARREEIFEYLAALPADGWERPFPHPTWVQLQFYHLLNLLPFHYPLDA